MKAHHKRNVEKKLADREARRGEFDQWLSENESKVPSEQEQERIARLSATEVVNEIKTRKVSAEMVMITMCSRAKRAGEQLASNTEELFMASIEAAQNADKFLSENGSAKCGRLFGLPISVKDHVNLKFTDSTCGMAARVLNPLQEDASVIEALIREGAIPFVKSNVPQMLMVPESVNRVFGRALNPWNVKRTPGGSSGGEGALITSYSSFLGVGTDIGGSIRIPAHFCGIVGFKPTPERISSHGVSAPCATRVSGQNSVKSTSGPMARHVKDLELVMKIWLDSECPMYKRDSYVPPVHFRPVNEKRRVRIGYFLEDGWFESAAGTQRAVLEAKAALEGQGYELVPFTVPNPREFVRLYFGVMAAEGRMQNLRSGLEDEDILEEYKSLYQISKVGKWPRKIISTILRWIGEERKAFVFQEGREKSVLEYFHVVRDLLVYRQNFITAMKNENIEAVLCPGGTLPAFPHGYSTELSVAASLTYLFNVLHFPTGTVPVTIMKGAEDAVLVNPVNDSWTKKALETLTDSEGLPVGVQIATFPWQDELCLKIMKDLEESIQFESTHETPFHWPLSTPSE